MSYGDWTIAGDNALLGIRWDLLASSGEQTRYLSCKESRLSV